MSKPAAKHDEDLNWEFPSTSHGQEQGFADSVLEYFQGDRERYVARETIQNAVDARRDYQQPVLVEFERYEMPVADVPGHHTLRDLMDRCLEFVSGQEKAEDFFENAIHILDGKTLPVLKISDYNTKGLSGSDDDRNGNWYRLVRVVGTSSAKGVAGGSFGIGKGAPIAASGIRTVFYSTINDEGKPVFQGTSRLVSHYDEQKDVRQGVGFYGLDKCRAIRKTDMVPPAFRRKEQGTDIYVMAYRSDGLWWEHLVKSVLDNFWLAIHNGDLEVGFKDGESTFKITKSNLGESFETYDAHEAAFFYRAATDPSSQSFSKELRHLGQVQLYVRKEEGAPGTVMMTRKPRMLVWKKQFRTLRDPYAGLFTCTDDKGNRLLRDLEPPKHDEWDPDRAKDVKDGHLALKELNDFIKESLRSMGEESSSEPQDIPGLKDYLPSSGEKDDSLQTKTASTEPTELEVEEETGREIGATKPPQDARVEKSHVAVTVVKAGRVTKPKKLGSKKGKGGGAKPALGGPGDDMGQRILTSDIDFRSFVPNSGNATEYRLIIKAHENCEGAIKLVAVGDDVNYPLGIRSARNADTGKTCDVSGPFIKGLSIKQGETLRLAFSVDLREKLTIGIENYEG